MIPVKLGKLIIFKEEDMLLQTHQVFYYLYLISFSDIMFVILI